MTRALPFIFSLAAFLMLGSDIRSQVRGPITVTSDASKKVPEASVVSAMVSSAEKVSGAKITGGISSVSYKDASPFGPSGTGIGWTVAGVSTINGHGASAQVVLNTLIDANGVVTAVYTNPSDAWVEPMDEPRNPEVTTAADGWIMGKDVPEAMTSTAADAIAAAWQNFGLDPAKVGQVIARPRWISAQFPARRAGDKLVPVRPTEKVWLVEICGAKFNETDLNGVEQYQTCKVMQFQDGTMEYMRGVFVP